MVLKYFKNARCYSALSFGYEAASLQQVKTGDAAGAGAGGSRCGKDGKRVKMTMPVLVKLLALMVQKCTY